MHHSLLLACRFNPRWTHEPKGQRQSAVAAASFRQQRKRINKLDRLAQFLCCCLRLFVYVRWYTHKFDAFQPELLTPVAFSLKPHRSQCIWCGADTCLLRQTCASCTRIVEGETLSCTIKTKKKHQGNGNRKQSKSFAPAEQIYKVTHSF